MCVPADELKRAKQQSHTSPLTATKQESTSILAIHPNPNFKINGMRLIRCRIVPPKPINDGKMLHAIVRSTNPARLTNVTYTNTIPKVITDLGLNCYCVGQIVGTKLKELEALILKNFIERRRRSSVLERLRSYNQGGKSSIIVGSIDKKVSVLNLRYTIMFVQIQNVSVANKIC